MSDPRESQQDGKPPNEMADDKKESPSGGPNPLGWPSAWTRWAFIAAVVVGMLMLTRLGGNEPAATLVDYSTFYEKAEAGTVTDVKLRGDSLDGTFDSPQKIDGADIEKFRTRLPTQEDPTLLPMLREHDVTIRAEPVDDSMWTQMLIAILPWVLIIGVWFWLSRRAQSMMGSGKGPFASILGATKKSFTPHKPPEVTFEDVAGLDAAKRDLGEIIAFLKAPEKFERMGGRLPRGALLVGSPGTGKTLLARAVAGEAGVPFFSISGSEFIELFVGVGASRVRELFEAAKNAAPAIVFIDEIDAVGRSRGTGLGGGHDEREQTLNQLLAAMDGFEKSDRTVVMAATNRPDVLDPALLRPGRFDRRIVVDLPAKNARRAILALHAKTRPIADDVDFDELAAATPGFSGAELANLVNEATLHAIRREAEKVTASDFGFAHDKILLGEPRDTHLSQAEKERVAVHESGHALVAFDKDVDAPLRRVSIIPRGMALGATQQSQREDKHLQTKSELQAKLAVLLGGYTAERELLGEVSSGAENDLRQATRIAQRMVAHFGMSDELGPVFHDHDREHPFLGARIASQSGVSDATIHAIETEARALLEQALESATETIRGERERLDRLVAALLEQETLDKDEIVSLLDAEAPASGPRAASHNPPPHAQAH